MKMKIRCAYDKIIPLSELKPYPKNRNQHPESQINRLAQILEYQGWRYPVKVSLLSGFVTSGHGRIEAARKNGWTEIPVNFQEYESEAQEYADVQSDNAIAAWAELDMAGINEDVGYLGPDFDLDLLGIEDFELEIADKYAEKDADEVPETPKETKTKPGDIYILGNHRLMCGDSTSIDAVEKLMDGEKAELCFTSPPYADQRDYNGGKELSTEHLARFISTAFGACNYFAVNLGYSRKNGEVNPYWNDYIAEADACGLKLLSWNVWDKGECGSVSNQTAMFGISHEWVFVFGSNPKELNRTVPNKNAGYFSNHISTRQTDGSVKKGKNRTVGDHSQLKTIYRCSAQKARDDIDHPARFPVELPEGYIEAMTDPGGSVYEPFCGSGSTLIACEKTNRKCFMMELDPHYCDVIVSRYLKFTDQKKCIRNGEEIEWQSD